MSDVSVETEPSQAEGPGEAQVKHEVRGQGQDAEAQRDPEDAQAIHEGAQQGRDSSHGADQYDDVVYDVDLSDSGDDGEGGAASQGHRGEARLDTGASPKDGVAAAPTGNDPSMDAKLKVTTVLCQPVLAAITLSRSSCFMLLCCLSVRSFTALSGGFF